MKNKIMVVKNGGRMNFYLHSDAGRMYLFAQEFSKGVYVYFKNGRAEAEIKQFNKWNLNPRLDKTITKLPMYIRYVMKECA